MLLFNLLPFVKPSALSVDYTSFYIKSTTDRNSQKITTTKNLLNFTGDKFSIPSSATDETIFYPLDDTKTHNCSIFTNNTLKSYETKVSMNDLNGLFLGLLKVPRNLVVSTRDYTNNQDLFNALDVEPQTQVTILPASLSVATHFATSVNQTFCIISTAGSKTTINIFEATDSNIKTVHKEEFDFFGDSLLDDIISTHVRETLKDRNVNLIPTLNKLDSNDLILDISDICKEIKGKLTVDLEICPIEEAEATNKNGDLRKPLENLSFNFSSIKEDFKKINIPEDFSKTINELCEKYNITRKLLISSYDSSIICDLTGLEGLLSVQDQFILKGALKFMKSNVKSDDERVYKNTKFLPSQISKLKDEIKIKNECMNKIEEIKNNELVFDHLPEDVLNNYTDFLLNSKDVDSLNLKEATEFINYIKKITLENAQVEKDKVSRPGQVKKLKDVLAEVTKLKEKRPEVWNNTLEKKTEEAREFLTAYEEDTNVLGRKFEDKAYFLEGIMESSVRSYEKKVREAAEKEKEKEAEARSVDEKAMDEVEGEKAMDEVEEEKETENVEEKAAENVEEKAADAEMEVEEKVVAENEVAENVVVENEVVEEKKVEDTAEAKPEDNKNENNEDPFDFDKMDPQELKAMQDQLKELMKDGNFEEMMKNFSENHDFKNGNPLRHENRDL